MSATVHAPRWELEDLLKCAVFVVEASSYEKQSLWERYAHEAADLDPCTNAVRVPWLDQGRGWLLTIGRVSKRPVVILIFGALLNGQPVLFCESKIGSEINAGLCGTAEPGGRIVTQ